MEDIRFILPNIRHKESFVEAMREGLFQMPPTAEDILLAETDFDAYMKKRRDLNYIFHLPGGRTGKRVPSTEFWLMRNDRFIGRVSIRHELTDHLREVGGHIGYAVRKSERGRGYARLMAQHALAYAKMLGLERVLATCNDDNLGTIRIIESMGGVLQDKIAVEGRPVLHRRYWIEL